MWGDIHKKPPLQAMSFNYNQLKQGMSLPRLPRNFADAIGTCWSLGVPYLWIDSLCILQDSKDDWGREAQAMNMVYKHAKITIVAYGQL
jgi:hypothetical protein